MTSRSSRRSLATEVLAAVAVVVGLVFALVLTGGARPAAGRSPTAASAVAARTRASGSPWPVTVTVLGHGAPVTIPRSFLELSTEYWTVPVWAKQLSLLGNVLASITPDGPMVLRIGGSSADQAVYSPSKELPEWAFEITRPWLSELRQIINRFGAKVILDLNTVTASPQIAIRWARAAAAALPTESIVGFGVPLFAPALAEPATHLNWISQLLGGAHPGLSAITVHRYPMSACTHNPSSSTFPTIAGLLSESSTAGMASTIRAAVALARHAHLPVRLTEMNSVTCGGRTGVSDTFATALWAPDALFESIKAGASSAAIHTRANATNMAFSLTSKGLVANPLFYGLALFSKTLGPSPRLLPLRVSPQRSLALKAWAVRIGQRQLHVLLINKSTHPAQVTLKLPATGAATAQDLLARTARAKTGVTLAGQQLNPQGQWVGTHTTSTISPNRGRYRLTVRGISATLLTVQAS